MSLKPGPRTFTQQRLESLLDEVRRRPPQSMYEISTLMNHDSMHAAPEHAKVEQMCMQLFDDTSDAEKHSDRLDSSIGRMFGISLSNMKSSEFDRNVIIRTISILRRLPTDAPDLQGILGSNERRLAPYKSPGSLGTSNVIDSASSDRLLVSEFVDCTVLRYALSQAHTQLLSELKGYLSPAGANPVAALNAKLELLRVSLLLANKQEQGRERWLIVCTFIWTSWQRFLMLFLDDGGDAQMIRGLRTVPGVFDMMRKQQKALFLQTPYLCGWAYRTLQNDLSCLGMDLRRFHELYRGHLGNRNAICSSSLQQCDGSSSYACRRFKDTKVTNQSMHSPICNGACRRLFWDPSSFLAVSGPKAVDIRSTDESYIRYYEATERTLTISHVWSHGQGGRPDRVGMEGTGFNTCLHRRYSDLAASLGYASYWMDTPCIPSEPKLRWDCIQNITPIFARSEKTVVCDRDLMAIDISAVTTDVCESILAILPVCDWSMRAWTLLEAIRGQDLFILCKDDRIINLVEVITIVRQSGRIEMPILYGRRNYLLPHPDIENFNLDLFETGKLDVLESDREAAEGFISIGEAAELLSHRHPTRDGDMLLIWSLMIGDLEDEDAETLWKRQIGKEISVGTLISSAPRLKCTGLSWAPSSPVVRPSLSSLTTARQTAYEPIEGDQTATGKITSEGFYAPWMAYKFLSAEYTMEKPERKIPRSEKLLARMTAIANQHTAGYMWGAFLRMCPRKGPKNVPVEYPKCKGHLLVVCASQDGVRWEWRDVLEWDYDTALPPFKLEKLLII